MLPERWVSIDAPTIKSWVQKFAWKSASEPHNTTGRGADSNGL